MSIYFISGHLSLTNEEFQEHYIPQLEKALEAKGTFVVGDARGADTKAQAWLREKGAEVIVYHMFTSPRNNVGNFPTKGGYISDEQRDCAMTLASDKDIAWVRTGREDSGTAKNLKRRLK